MSIESIKAELVAVVVGIDGTTPCVLAMGKPPRLPAGELMPSHRSLQAGVRAWVEEKSGLRLGYVEQLYTFADADRDGVSGHTFSVSYLGLTSGVRAIGDWLPWYSLMPWEDLRSGTQLIDQVVAPKLRQWAESSPIAAEQRTRWQRCEVDFGLDGHRWLTDLVLQRYELLYEAGLVPESPDEWRRPAADLVPGERMFGDHRRILATGLARLRAKIQYRPVVFELLPQTFTLGQLQLCVEALAGQCVHKQNFRRLVEQQELVEETGDVDASTGGRPARLYRFRREILQERQFTGTKLPTSRGR